MRLLLVEDDPVDARITIHAIEAIQSPRYEVVHVRTLDEGVAEISAGGYQAAIVDLRLPPYSGQAVVDKFAPAAARGGAPILILTGLSDGEMLLWREGLIAAGAEAILSKPSSTAELGRTLAEAKARRLRDLERGPARVAAAVAEVGRTLGEQILAVDQGLAELSGAYTRLSADVVSIAEIVRSGEYRIESTPHGETSQTTGDPGTGGNTSGGALVALGVSWQAMDLKTRASVVGGILGLLAAIGSALAAWTGQTLPTIPAPVSPTISSPADPITVPIDPP